MASACTVLFTDVEFEAALSNSLRHFLPISDLKHEQKFFLETVAKKRDIFGILPTGFGKSLIFQWSEWLPASTERLVKTTTCLCFSCDAFSFYNERPG